MPAAGPRARPPAAARAAPRAAAMPTTATATALLAAAALVAPAAAQNFATSSVLVCVARLCAWCSALRPCVPLPRLALNARCDP